MSISAVYLLLDLFFTNSEEIMKVFNGEYVALGIVIYLGMFYLAFILCLIFWFGLLAIGAYILIWVTVVYPKAMPYLGYLLELLSLKRPYLVLVPALVSTPFFIWWVSRWVDKEKK